MWLIENLSRGSIPALTSSYLFYKYGCDYMGHMPPGILYLLRVRPARYLSTKRHPIPKVREQRPGEDGVSDHPRPFLFISNNVINYHNPHLPSFLEFLMHYKGFIAVGPTLTEASELVRFYTSFIYTASYHQGDLSHT